MAVGGEHVLAGMQRGDGLRFDFGPFVLAEIAAELRRFDAVQINLGFVIVNIDSTVILERPKLKLYRDPIRQRLAESLQLPVERVSVKFKTAEGVGPVGEKRSVEAQAIVLLQRD